MGYKRLRHKFGHAFPSLPLPHPALSFFVQSHLFFAREPHALATQAKCNMAEVLQSILTEFITSSPNLYPVKLEEDSYPVVGSSFSSTQFLLDYYEDPERQSLVSKLIYVSSKVRYVYVSSSSLHVCYRITEFATYHNPAV